MKTPRFYLDTSVFGGYFDPEFEAPTRRLFNLCAGGGGIILASNITLEEMREAPERVQALLTDPSGCSVEFVKEDEESVALAEAYVDAGIVAQNHYDDCRHVALASVTQADLLVSWNFRHIVRFDKIKAFNAVNMLHGYRTVDIMSPLEVGIDEY